MPVFLRNYLLRHQHPGNRALHMVGLPVTFVLPVILLIQQAPGWALASFLIGYGLQFLGHAIEGNDAGELILLKKLLGKPYIAVVPRVQISGFRERPTHGIRRSESNFAE